jgi:hypothetical protein
MDEAKQGKYGRVFNALQAGATLLAATIGVIAIILSWSNDAEIERLNYSLGSVGHRPLLKLAGEPEIIDIELDSLTLRFPEDTAAYTNESDSILIELGLGLHVTSLFKITNASESSIGRICMSLATDTKLNFKRFMTGEEVPDSIRGDFKRWADSLNSHVPPGDTVELTVTIPVVHLAHNGYTLHFVLLYTSELGHMYHTHTSIPFVFRIPWFQVQEETKVSVLESQLRETVRHGIEAGTFMRSVKPVSDYATYSKDEAELTRTHLRKLMPDISFN